MFKYFVKTFSFVFFCIVTVNTAIAEQPPNKLPNVVILATGGTIAGTGSSVSAVAGYVPSQVKIDSLISSLPELKQVANVRGEQIFQMLSQNMTSDHWLKLAKRINELLATNEVDGIVVTQGTDTIDETAYFLNLTVKSKKPVVVVGAMRPSTAISSDGPMNLYNGVILAGSKEAIGKGVMVMLNDEIHAAREVHKASTSLLHTFQSPEGVLGYMHHNAAHFYRTPVRIHTDETEFDISKLTSFPQVDIVYGYTNNNSIAVNAFIEHGAKGIVHAGVGNGNLSDAMSHGLIEARKKGAVIVRSSRVGQGIVTRNGETNDDSYDFIASDTLNPEKARILLMLALTKTQDTKEIQRMFYTY